MVLKKFIKIFIGVPTRINRVLCFVILKTVKEISVKVPVLKGWKIN